MAWHDVPTIEIVMGKNGLMARRNQNLVPIGAYKTLRNATLEDDSLRTAAGATALGSSVGAVALGAGIDYWPDVATQRTVVFDATNGTIQKDDGLGGSWASLVSGLTTSGAVPQFVIGGQELAGLEKKLFYCDRVNAVRVLKSDAAAMSTLALPPLDWTGSQQPAWMCQHERWVFGGGNLNAPKTVYRCKGDEHENWRDFAWTYLVTGDYERLVAARSYKGGLLLWGYPEGAWFLDTSSDDDKAWRAVKVGTSGASGPENSAQIEDDVLWVAPDGSLHLISATNATGSARASDISYEALGAFIPSNINVAQLATAQLIYYQNKQKALLACHGRGGTAKNRAIEWDVAKVRELGGRFIYHDRHRNESLFLRKVSGVATPHFGDAAGQVWTMDRPTRSDDGTGYTLEWALTDEDFARIYPGWAGKKKNGRFIQLEYDPRSTATHTIQAIRDGRHTQNIPFDLASEPGALPQTLSFTLGEAILTPTRPKRLLGQARRWGFKGTSSGAGKDISLTKLILGLELAE